MDLEDSVVDRVLKEAGYKVAKKYEIGDMVVLADQVQGLSKGVIYKVLDNQNPGKITIGYTEGYNETHPYGESDNPVTGGPNKDGALIGEYPADRFVKFNHNW